MVIDKRAQFLNKRAQFFLLAAVIIVAVVISFGVSVNQAVVNKEPEDLRSFNYEVKKEAGAVLDYEVYDSFDENINLDDFVDLLAEDIKDKNPDANFVIIYGDSIYGIMVRNEGINVISVNGEEVEGIRKTIICRVCHNNICEDIELTADTFDEDAGRWIIESSQLEGQDTVQVEVNKQIVEFSVSEHRQVASIIQKDVGDESFVSIG